MLLLATVEGKLSCFLLPEGMLGCCSSCNIWQVGTKLKDTVGALMVLYVPFLAGAAPGELLPMAATPVALTLNKLVLVAEGMSAARWCEVLV